AACQGAYIKTFDGGDSGSLVPNSGTDTTDANGNTNFFLEPGLVTRLMPNEEVGVIDFKRNSTESEIFVNLLIRTIAVGCGVSFERLARDYSKTNFSSNRAGDLEDRREFRPMQNWLVNSLCKPYWNRLLWYGVANRLPGFPTPVDYVFNPAFYEKCEWIAPGWEWVDPKNQALAEQIGLETGITNIFDIWLSQGKDPEEQIEKLRKQNELKAELGLTFSKEQPQEQGADDGEEE
ncbi:MAG TPA: phage portal protein, partial [Planctomycetaceae bacterium]|nr:phage portal protein [Planctomycetaceae bacterium]